MKKILIYGCYGTCVNGVSKATGFDIKYDDGTADIVTFDEPVSEQEGDRRLAVAIGEAAHRIASGDS